jgi:hypothetical protein
MLWRVNVSSSRRAERLLGRMNSMLVLGERGLVDVGNVIKCEVELVGRKTSQSRELGRRYLYLEDKCPGMAEIPIIGHTTATRRKGVPRPRVGGCRKRDTRGVQHNASYYTHRSGTSRNMSKVLFIFKVQLCLLHSGDNTPKSKISTRLSWSIADCTQSKKQTSQVNSNEAPEMLVASISLARMLPAPTCTVHLVKGVSIK